MKAFFRFLLPFLLGAASGAGGYYGWQDYLPASGLIGDPAALGPSPLEALPYGMVVAKSNFAARPVFCIEQPQMKTETRQVCKVSPGFYATYVNGLLHSVEWDIADGARFQNEWRKAGLSTNQSGAEFMDIVQRIGARKVRFELDGEKAKILTFDVGNMTYRLWLEADDVPAEKKPAKGSKKKDEDKPAPALGIGPQFMVTKLATILSFD